MADTSLIYWQEKLGKTQARRLRVSWSVVSGAFTECVAGNPILLTQGAISAQSTIDNFLGTVSEFNYLAYDATSMGTDAVGVIIDMKGQAIKVLNMSLNMYSSTYLGTAAGCRALGSAGITATTLESAVACGYSSTITGSGNIAVKGVISGLDAITGLVVLDVDWISK
jgi:hypothetical protein